MKTSNRQHPIACPEFADRLVDLSDGELSAGERAAVDAHIAHCGPCREQLARLNTSLAVLRTAVVAAAPAGATLRRPASRASLWIAVGSTAAAILMAIGAASLSDPPPVVEVDQNPPHPATLTTDDALRRIALLEQQARLEMSLALLPDDPWFADRRAANEELLSTYRAAAASGQSLSTTPASKEPL